MSELINDAIKARDAAVKMAVLPEQTKNDALANISRALTDSSAKIFSANGQDLSKAQEDNLSGPLLKRLKFDDHKLSDVTMGIKGLISLEDPVGKKLLHTTLDEGLDLYRITCPIGVIGVVFESRPDALVQIATLCVKSGNAVFLKGGREANNTNKVLADIIYNAGTEAGLPEGWLHLITTREDVSAMLSLDQYIDLIIPRGSNEFVQYIMKNTLIPVMGHADGVCHTYIDKDADIDLAVKVTVDAKTQYVSVCNATETILIHKDIKDRVIPVLYPALEEKGVTIFEEPSVSDWHHEYLDYKVSVKIVSDISEAIEHINRYGSGHTDAIITEDKDAAELFMDMVDSGSVLHNCSTRFADGFRYGFGAEVGISTSKLHARGPVGLEGLVSYKYKLYGHGDIVADYASGNKTFKHIRREDI
ncbi:MAG: glutamate-5-semialdehyde dehydrogenase [Clostridiales bacterium]|nr:glutamate-5-semialdehyde dehydrogenase [Clostridiales bacterium]